MVDRVWKAGMFKLRRLRLKIADGARWCRMSSWTSFSFNGNTAICRCLTMLVAQNQLLSKCKTYCSVVILIALTKFLRSHLQNIKVTALLTSNNSPSLLSPFLLWYFCRWKGSQSLNPGLPVLNFLKDPSQPCRFLKFTDMLESRLPFNTFTLPIQ